MSYQVKFRGLEIQCETFPDLEAILDYGERKSAESTIRQDTLPARNKALVRQLIEEVWNKGNLDLADELLAVNFEGHDPADAKTTRGREQYRLKVQKYRNAFPDLELRIDNILADENQVVARWQSTGTHQGPLGAIPPTEQDIDVTGITILRIDEGQIQQEWANWDSKGLLQQLGAIAEITESETPTARR